VDITEHIMKISYSTLKYVSQQQSKAQCAAKMPALMYNQQHAM